MTPEGLNSRLTFLQQCARPGDTIPTIGPNGEKLYNDALNTSFGAPPVLVLRVGDFFNTKIIPTGINFVYACLNNLSVSFLFLSVIIVSMISFKYGFSFLGIVVLTTETPLYLNLSVLNPSSSIMCNT